MRKFEIKHVCMSKSQLKLMNLMMLKKKKLRSALKKESEKEGRLPKITNF